MSFSLGIKLTKMVSGVGEPNTPGRREKKVIKEQKTKANGSMNIVRARKLQAGPNTCYK